MKTIELTQGYSTIVDDDCFDELNRYKWYYSSRGYAVRNSSTGKGKRTKIFMHSVVNNTPEGLQTDHINMNQLDNRRENTRTVTNQQNQFNQSSRKNTSSKFKGVCWHKRDRIWTAQTIHYGKHIHLGYYKNETDAAIAYNIYATEHFGDFAKLNAIEKEV